MFIKVRVKTGERKELVDRLASDRFTISVKEKAEQNAANRRVIEILACELSVPVKRIRFVSGQRSPSKLFEIK
jgi:uncharacterized protein YggU (UPF0235/DUF167 family)